MNGRNITTNQTPNEMGCCGRKTLVDTTRATGAMIEEALIIANEIKHVLYGIGETGEKRPEPDCLEMEMQINEKGMSSLLAVLHEIRGGIS